MILKADRLLLADYRLGINLIKIFLIITAFGVGFHDGPKYVCDFIVPYSQYFVARNISTASHSLKHVRLYLQLKYSSSCVNMLWVCHDPQGRLLIPVLDALCTLYSLWSYQIPHNMNFLVSYVIQCYQWIISVENHLNICTILWIFHVMDHSTEFQGSSENCICQCPPGADLWSETLLSYISLWLHEYICTLHNCQNKSKQVAMQNDSMAGAICIAVIVSKFTLVILDHRLHWKARWL